MSENLGFIETFFFFCPWEHKAKVKLHKNSKHNIHGWKLKRIGHECVQDTYEQFTHSDHLMSHLLSFLSCWSCLDLQVKVDSYCMVQPGTCKVEHPPIFQILQERHYNYKLWWTIHFHKAVESINHFRYNNSDSLAIYCIYSLRQRFPR